MDWGLRGTALEGIWEKSHVSCQGASSAKGRLYSTEHWCLKRCPLFSMPDLCQTAHFFLVASLSSKLVNDRHTETLNRYLVNWTELNIVQQASALSASICHEVMGPDAMFFVFWMLSFKPTFSLSSFTFIKRQKKYIKKIFMTQITMTVWSLT